MPQNYEVFWVLSVSANSFYPISQQQWKHSGRWLTRVLSGSGAEENEAFEALHVNNLLDDALMMAFYDKEAPTEVVTDANPVGLEGILV